MFKINNKIFMTLNNIHVEDFDTNLSIFEQKLDSISVPVDESFLNDIEWRITNETWLQISRKIALKLLQYRRENNLTHNNLCQILNIDETILRQMLKGCYNYDLKFITEIETKFDLKLIQIL